MVVHDGDRISANIQVGCSVQQLVDDHFPQNLLSADPMPEKLSILNAQERESMAR